jgi:hypothetical protein
MHTVTRNADRKPHERNAANDRNESNGALTVAGVLRTLRGGGRTMPTLTDPRREAFAQARAAGQGPTEALASAGYRVRFPRQRASQLENDSAIKERIAELLATAMASSTAALQEMFRLEIKSRTDRIRALQDRHQRLLLIMHERAADPRMANVPGGKSGLLVRRLRAVGREIVEEYEIDAALLAEVRAHERQVAEELGQYKQVIQHRVTPSEEITDDELISIIRRAQEAAHAGEIIEAEFSEPLQSATQQRRLN